MSNRKASTASPRSRSPCLSLRRSNAFDWSSELKEINSLERVRAIAQPLQLRDPDTEDTEEEILDVGDVIPETEKDLKREAFVATVLHHVHSFLTRDVIGEAQKQLDGVLGLELGLRPFVKVASYVEVSPFCRDVIKARIQDQLADPGPILEDIKQVSAGDLGDDIDGFLAGFPCQDKSEDVQPIKKK